MTINIPHFSKDIDRLALHQEQGLLVDLITDDRGMIGCHTDFAVQYRPGAKDHKGKPLQDEMWYRGVRYISTDRPVYFKTIIADINARIIPQEDIVNGFLHDQAKSILNNPPAGFVNSKPWVLQNYNRCWSTIVSELEFLTFWKP